MAVIEINSDNFEKEVLQAGEPVLIDFWAPWCGPCKMLSPLVDEVAEDAQGFKVGKINVDDCPELARPYKVFSIPTLIVFKNGEEAKRSVGVITKEAILDLVK